MKRIFSAFLFLACTTANAQFVTGQILTASQLNAAFANVLATSGGTLTGPLTVQGNTTVANLTVNGTFTVPGGFSPSSLSPQAANTVLANVAGSSASPVAAPIPSCSTANSAIKYTSGTGWGCGATFGLTSGTLGQFAATTSAQLAGVVSDESGSGSLLFGTSPTIAAPAITGGTISGTPVSGSSGSFTTLAASSTVSGTGFTNYLASPPAIGGTAPAAGAFTTIAASGLISPASTIGIKGTTTNDSAQAGSLGAMPAPTNLTSVPLTAFTVANTSSVLLPAGDYWVQAVTQFVPTSTTAVFSVTVGVSPTSASVGALGTYTISTTNATANIGNVVIASPMTRVRLATTTTIYNVSSSNFNTSTLAASGYLLISNAR